MQGPLQGPKGQRPGHVLARMEIQGTYIGLKWLYLQWFEMTVAVTRGQSLEIKGPFWKKNYLQKNAFS